MLNKEILRMAQEGNQKAVEEICLLTWEQIYRFIYFRVQNRQEAEDITQETFVKTLSYLNKNCINPDRFVTFLKKVALNIIKDRWRMKKRHGPRICLDLLNPEESSVSDDSEILALRELIKKGLDSLTHEQRTVIELRIIQGYSVHDTAAVLGKTDGAVRVIQYRALHNLAQYLEKHY